MKGLVKWYDTKKGYGFITYKGKDIFAHASQIIGSDTLIDGEMVEFQIAETIYGLRAKSIKSLK